MEFKGWSGIRRPLGLDDHATSARQYFLCHCVASPHCSRIIGKGRGGRMMDSEDDEWLESVGRGSEATMSVRGVG